MSKTRELADIAPGMYLFVIQLGQQAEGVAVPGLGPQKVKGREEEMTGREVLYEKLFTVVHVTKHFPLGENT